MKKLLVSILRWSTIHAKILRATWSCETVHTFVSYIFWRTMIVLNVYFSGEREWPHIEVYIWWGSAHTGGACACTAIDSFIMERWNDDSRWRQAAGAVVDVGLLYFFSHRPYRHCSAVLWRNSTCCLHNMGSLPERMSYNHTWEPPVGLWRDVTERGNPNRYYLCYR
jgi:hypothetical protein